MTTDTPRPGFPSMEDGSGADEVKCPKCEHANGDSGWNPFRALAVRLGIPRKPRPTYCGDTQPYIDDELHSCNCRHPFHSN